MMHVKKELKAKAREWFEIIGLQKTPESMCLYDKLLKEELTELIYANTEHETIDAIGDIAFVLHGISYIANEKDGENNITQNASPGALVAAAAITQFDEHAINLALDAVVESNYTKFCKTRAEALKSITKYNEQGIQTYYKKQNDYYVLYVREDTVVGDKYYPAGKVMKSINFQPPKLKTSTGVGIWVK